MTEVRLTKLEAARRQLETAIRLYFSEVDPASVHTLAAAAGQLLKDLNRHRDGAPMLSDQILQWAKPEFKNEILRKFAEAENYLKHADRDPDQILEFDTQQSEFLILDSCETYRRLTGERLPLLAIFQMWSWLTWARRFVNDETWERHAANISTRYGPNPTRQTFFSTWLPVAYDASTQEGAR